MAKNNDDGAHAFQHCKWVFRVKKDGLNALLSQIPIQQ